MKLLNACRISEETCYVTISSCMLSDIVALVALHAFWDICLKMSLIVVVDVIVGCLKEKMSDEVLKCTGKLQQSNCMEYYY